MALTDTMETERLREVLLPELLSCSDLDWYGFKFLHELDNHVGEFTFNDAVILQAMHSRYF